MNSQITLQNISEIKLIGITHIGEFEKGLINTPHIKTLIIYHDNPRITQNSKVRWSACLVIEKSIETEGEIRNLSIKGGTYAVGHFEIEASLFEKAWETVLSWAKENGYTFDDREYFELYYGDFKAHPEQKFIIDICIPVK